MKTDFDHTTVAAFCGFLDNHGRHRKRERRHFLAVAIYDIFAFFQLPFYEMHQNQVENHPPVLAGHPLSAVVALVVAAAVTASVTLVAPAALAAVQAQGSGAGMERSIRGSEVPSGRS